MERLDNPARNRIRNSWQLLQSCCHGWFRPFDGKQLPVPVYKHGEIVFQIFEGVFQLLEVVVKPFVIVEGIIVYLRRDGVSFRHRSVVDESGWRA